MHPPFFFVYRQMRFLTLGRSVRLKKKTLKKNHKKSRNSRPWYPRTTSKVNSNIFGWTKCTTYCKKCSCFCSCFSLSCYYAQFSDEEDYFKWKTVELRLWAFCFENAKNLGRSDDSKLRKKRGWPNVQFKRIKPLLSNLEFNIVHDKLISKRTFFSVPTIPTLLFRKGANIDLFDHEQRKFKYLEMNLCSVAPTVFVCFCIVIICLFL